jgi:hypothetical protein
MDVPRAVQTATRLEDGTILVAGGCDDPGCDLGTPGGMTAEIFDPDTGIFTATGPLPFSVDDHTATLLQDGRVLVAGGWTTRGVVASTELYDPTSRTFSPGPHMLSRRSGCCAVRLRDGRVLMIGGFTAAHTTTAAAELFDPGTDEFLATGSMSAPRGSPAAALLPDGRVFVAGGISRGRIVASAEVYDPASGRFSRTGSMFVARYKAGAVTLRDGTVMVIGGSGDVDGQFVFATTEIYDPANGTFSSGPTMHWPRYKITGSVVPLADGNVLVAGGAVEPEVYDVRTKEFLPVDGALDHTRLFLSAAPIDGRRVLLVGGYDLGIDPTAQAWLFDGPARGANAGASAG